MRSFLLDTSILEARTIKVPVVSATVANACRKMQKRGAAEYAILEYHNAVVEETQFLLERLQEKRDLLLVSEHVNRITGASRDKRKANMCREILTRLEIELRKVFDKCYPPDAKDFHAARAEHACTLLSEFQRNWIKELRRIVDCWERSTQCYWVRQLEAMSPWLPKVVKVRCRPDNVRCGIVQFLDTRAATLATLEEALRKMMDAKDSRLTDELIALYGAIQALKGNRNAAADYRTGCRCFADALHVLESDRYDAIYSMNPKEFGPLCQMLQKRFVLQDHRGTPPDLTDSAGEVGRG
ncbi:MAG: hypothetical protein NTW87_16790 [Planctomycetota bacterium]|nr:hypothetical protein [Planctomycetota bacterium]